MSLVPQQARDTATGTASSTHTRVAFGPYRPDDVIRSVSVALASQADTTNVAQAVEALVSVALCPQIPVDDDATFNALTRQPIQSAGIPMPVTAAYWDATAVGYVLFRGGAAEIPLNAVPGLDVYVVVDVYYGSGENAKFAVSLSRKNPAIAY